MKTTDTSVTLKNSKKVEVKLLVPYAIIVSIVLAFAGTVYGWNLREDMSSKIQTEAHSISKLSK